MDQRTEADLRSIHSHCFDHRSAIEKSPLVGCFFCQQIFEPSLIDEWLEEATGASTPKESWTAFCPKCGIDSVLPGSSVELSPSLLKQMNDFWF